MNLIKREYRAAGTEVGDCLGARSPFKSLTRSPGAAKLAAVPAGGSPVRWKYPDATVVISDGEEGDRLDRKLGSKSLWRPMGTLVRSAREASNSAGCNK